jgi:AraC-like DNA-binding protein
MSLSLNVTRGLAAFVRERGIPTDVFLRQAGLSEELFAEPHPPLADREAGRALRVAHQLTNEPALGLRLGASAPPHMLSVVGQLLLACPTIREALGEMERYMPLLLRDSYLRLEEQDSERALLVLDVAPEFASSRFVTELALTMILRMGKQLVPQAATPFEVRVRHQTPPWAALYDEAFGCPTRFSAPRDEIVFPAHWLDLPQPFADESLRALLRHRAELLLRAQETQKPVRTRVRTLLLEESSLGDVDSGSVARRVGMTPRSLRRRLRQEGVVLSDLVDELRREIAFRELREADTPIKQIADRVGFSEVSAFHRAFKRWTGMTPAKYRAGEC